VTTIARLTARNLRLFVRDRTTVLFSLLSPFILIVLYVLFLGHLQVESLQEKLPLSSDDDIVWFVNSWVLAGITMITTVTASLGALGVFVDDRATERFRDFLISPVSRVQLILGYTCSSFIVSVLMSLIVLIGGQGYLAARSFDMMPPEQWAQVLGYVVVASATFAAMSGFAVTWIKSIGGYAGLSTIVGTLIGFLAIAYIPAGALPSGVVSFLNALPFAQTARLIREPYTDAALETMTNGEQHMIDSLRDNYGITGDIGDVVVSDAMALGALAGLFILFSALSAWRLGQKIKA
jgi:multidrug/hemolysin transport system permease protein